MSSINTRLTGSEAVRRLERAARRELSIEAMRQTGAEEEVAVLADEDEPGKAGVFFHSATDPYGQGDDGDNVLDAGDGGFWVRITHAGTGDLAAGTGLELTGDTMALTGTARALHEAGENSIGEGYLRRDENVIGLAEGPKPASPGKS